MRAIAAAAIPVLLACVAAEAPTGRAWVWDDAKKRGVEFRAVGNEPGWLLEIGPERIVFEFDYGASRASFPLTEPLVDDDTGKRTWFLEADGAPARVFVEDRECLDTMADDPPYPARVEVQLGDRTFRGCGMPLSGRSFE